MTPVTDTTHAAAVAALNLHRLMLAAEDVQHSKSPVTYDRPSDGIARPTEDAVMCPRRAHVRWTADYVADQARQLADLLADAVDVWEGRGPDPVAP